MNQEGVGVHTCASRFRGAHTFTSQQARIRMQQGAHIFTFFAQIRYGFGLPFPLNVVLLPASIFETILTQMVGQV